MRVKVLVAVVAIVAAFTFLRDLFAASPKERSVWPPPPAAGEALVNTETPEPESPPTEVSFVCLADSTELTELLKSFGAPPRPNSFSFEPLVGLKPQEGMKVLETVLYSGYPESFLGRFDHDYVVPGAVIDCMPFVRADLEEPVRTMGGLARAQYKVVLQNSDGGTTPVEWKIPASKQDEQIATIKTDVIAPVQSRADQFATTTRLTLREQMARSFTEAQARIGLSLETKLLDVSAEYSVHSTKERSVFLGMIEQEYYRLSAAEIGDTVGPYGWLADDPRNLQVLRGLEPNGEALPGVPAVIKEVRYGRIVLFAFELDRAALDQELEVHAEGRKGTTKVTLDAWGKLLQQSQSNTALLMVYGGGVLPDIGAEAIPKSSDSYEVASDQARKTLDKILDAGKEWNKDNPGVPIGIEFQLLDAAGTRLAPFTSSLTTMVSQLESGANWAFDLEVEEVGDDFDGGSESGEWKIYLNSTTDENRETLFNGEHEYSVDSGSSFAAHDASKDPVFWGQDLGEYKLLISEQDDFLRGGDDESTCFLTPAIRLDEPAAQREFRVAALELGNQFLSLQETLVETMSLEGADGSVSSAQANAEAAHEKGLEALAVLVTQASAGLNALKAKHEAAKEALTTLENVGIKATGSADSNDYVLSARPSLTNYHRWNQSVVDRYGAALRTARAYSGSD